MPHEKLAIVARHSMVTYSKKPAIIWVPDAVQLKAETQ